MKIQMPHLHQLKPFKILILSKFSITPNFSMRVFWSLFMNSFRKLRVLPFLNFQFETVGFNFLTINLFISFLTFWRKKNSQVTFRFFNFLLSQKFRKNSFSLHAWNWNFSMGMTKFHERGIFTLLPFFSGIRYRVSEKIRSVVPALRNFMMTDGAASTGNSWTLLLKRGTTRNFLR